MQDVRFYLNNDVKCARYIAVLPVVLVQQITGLTCGPVPSCKMDAVVHLLVLDKQVEKAAIEWAF